MNWSAEEKQWAAGTAEKLKGKMRAVTERNRDKIPYTAVNGVFNDMGKDDIAWWTNGFWGGMMWQMHALTGEELYKEEAVKTEEKLDVVLMNDKGLDHDNGFKWLPTAVVNYKVTKNPASLNRAMLAAGNLAGRFNLAGHFIRAWNDN